MENHSHGKDCKEVLSVLLPDGEEKTVLILSWSLQLLGSLKLHETWVQEMQAIFLLTFCPALAWGPSFYCISQTFYLQMVFLKWLICSLEGSGHSGACLSSSPATEFLIQVMWLWQAIYHAVEKDLHPSLDLIVCYGLIVYCSLWS